MVKRWFLVGGILLLVSLLVTGCGVPKEDYEAVVAERDSVQSELQSVRSELSAVQLTIEAQEQAMAQAKTAAEIINALFIPVLKGEESLIDPFEFLFEWSDKVKAAEDAELQRLFNAVMDSEAGDQELMDFFLYLFESIPKTLE